MSRDTHVADFDKTAELPKTTAKNMFVELGLAQDREVMGYAILT